VPTEAKGIADGSSLPFTAQAVAVGRPRACRAHIFCLHRRRGGEARKIGKGKRGVTPVALCIRASPPDSGVVPFSEDKKARHIRIELSFLWPTYCSFGGPVTRHRTALFRSMHAHIRPSINPLPEATGHPSMAPKRKGRGENEQSKRQPLPTGLADTRDQLRSSLRGVGAGFEWAVTVRQDRQLACQRPKTNLRPNSRSDFGLTKEPISAFVLP